MLYKPLYKYDMFLWCCAQNVGIDKGDIPDLAKVSCQLCICIKIV